MGIDLGRFRSKKNDEWLDWLEDDPVPASLRARMRQKAVQEASRPVVRRPGQSQPQSSLAEQTATKTAKDPSVHSVSIHISVPKFKKLSLPKKLPKLPKNLTYKQVGIGAGSLAIVLVIGVVALNSRNYGKNSGEKGVLSASNQQANFATLTPGDGSKASDKRYNPDRKIVSFTDTIGGVDITISQQQLPDDFKDNPQDKVKKLAESFSATKVLSTANPTAYQGTSIKGPQTVIFTKNGLLVFIQSTKQIDDHDWAEYITNLK